MDPVHPMAASPQMKSNLVPVKVPSVAAELEAIFLEATGKPSIHSADRGASAVVGRIDPAAPRPARVPAARLGVLGAVILSGISAAAVLLPQHNAVSSSGQPQAAVAAVTRVRPSDLSSLHLAANAQVQPQPVAAPVVRPMRVKSAPPHNRSHARVAGRPSFDDLMVADQRLRRAYGRAISAGVPRPVLVDYHNRWADLRQEASWQPERVRLGYNAMAADLTRMSASHRRRRAGGSHRW